MATLFDISNILAGLILGASVLTGFGLKISGGFGVFLKTYRWVFGVISLVFGIIFLFQPGYIVHDIVGILAGLLLLSDSLQKVAGIGDQLTSAAKALLPFEAFVGIAALVVGTFGLLNIGIFA